MSAAAETASEQSVGTIMREAFAPQDIEDAIDRFDRTYRDDGFDLEARLALFSEDVVLDDPVSSVMATSRAELEAFFERVEAMGARQDRRQLDRIVIAREALVRYEARIRVPGMVPETLHYTVNYMFNAECKICKVRVFFDLNSIGAPVSF